MTQQQPNTCNRCLQTSDKFNKIGQCPACSKEGDWARKMTLRGRDLKNISGFQEMVKKERVKLFAELL